MKSIFFVFISSFTILTAVHGQPISNDIDHTINFSFRDNIIECERASVIEDYQNDYLGTSVSSLELDWSGNVDNCDEGKISDLAMERTMRRINYFRNLVGIDNGIIFNEVKNEKCQKAVLMMDAENKLDHFPTSDWKCSSHEGIEAAGKSNLSYGGHSSASVPQYIRDAGSGNGAVGHRRWILYPKAYEFGFGSTNWGTAMWVIGGTQSLETYPEFVAYPSPGYCPKNLIYPRWSFSKKGANYSAAHIKMYDEKGDMIDYQREEITNGFGDNTLVWIPVINLYDESLGTDAYFKVIIDSVNTGGNYENFEYEVLGILPEPYNEPITYSQPSCENANGQISINIPAGYKSIAWSNGLQDTELISGLIAGNYSTTITDKIGCEQVLNFVLEDMNVPKVLNQINGNLTAFSNQSVVYSTEQHIDGNYLWNITNGTIINQTSNHEIEVVWDEGASDGQLCVFFTDFEACQSNEICIDIELSTSMTEELFAERVESFPNPVTGQLNVYWPTSNDLTYFEIKSTNGYSISKTNVTRYQNNMLIDVHDLSNGVYFLLLHFQDKVVLKKIIKL